MTEVWTITFDVTTSLLDDEISETQIEATIRSTDVVGKGGIVHRGTWPTIYPELAHRYRLLALKAALADALERRPA